MATAVEHAWCPLEHCSSNPQPTYTIGCKHERSTGANLGNLAPSTPEDDKFRLKVPRCGTFVIVSFCLIGKDAATRALESNMVSRSSTP